MKKIEEIEIQQMGGITETHVVIYDDNGGYVSMPKSVYDEQLAQNEAEAL